MSTMYAIIESGSKQLRVSEGDFVEVELLGIEAGQKVTFDKVYFIGNNGSSKVGTPLVSGAKVTGEVEGDIKGPKLISFKFKRRKGFKKMIGHRQKYSRVKITKITG